MDRFDKISFCGTFRDYQQRVLDNFKNHIKDGKINIVAAPGSGKTVLGLELIRRLKSPCIILSPTTAIREQWGARFKDLFLEDKSCFDELFSTDLHDVKLYNSVTYQALYTAIDKVTSEDSEDTDLSDIDIFATIKKNGIKTICLDEAHHLKNEWQKALEKFVSSLDKDVKIISLTATPPYDSDGMEWDRYLEICGEIDEEIFVPELVGQNTLCPHQDYVYFNFPSKEEVAAFEKHRENAVSAISALKSTRAISSVYTKLNYERDYDKLFSFAKEHIAILVLLKHYGYEINKGLIKELTTKRELPKFNISFAQVAISHLLVSEYTTEEERDEIISVLKENSVYEKRKVSLELGDRLKRTLISSVGKLASISDIAKSEYASLGERLRMLVLTDYIRKENVNKIGTDEDFSSVNVVSIFETVRNALPDAKIGVLSGTLIILPDSIVLSDVKHRRTAIEATGYSVVDFSGSNHKAVDYVGKLFESGKITVLVGTKSLLGEGWDSPCINTLILASFVGSFVLSNQMRGRAIRIDKNNPDKVSNVWHLVTVEPEYLFAENMAQANISKMLYNKDELTSYDYDVLKRRFDSFMGPAYEKSSIESGIDRISAIKPPYTKKGIEKINAEMLELSKKRDEVKDSWTAEVGKSSFNVVSEVEIPTEKRVPVFTFYNAILLATLSILSSGCIHITGTTYHEAGFFVALIIALATIPVYVLLVSLLMKFAMHINPGRSFKTMGVAVYKTLKECELITPGARVEATKDSDALSVSLYLRNATIHDQNIFNTAMKELLSPIENPRYILIKKNIFGGYKKKHSFACPSIIGKNKEYVAVLVEKLRLSTGKFDAVYTRNQSGREIILKCRRASYITSNMRTINPKFKVRHWE